MIDGIITQLILLFDGKDPDYIASAIAAALPTDRAERVLYQLAYKLGINIGMSISPGDMLGEIYDRNDFEDNKHEFVGTHEQLVRACQNYEWGDYGDHFGDAMSNLLDELVEAKLVKVTPKVIEEPTP